MSRYPKPIEELVIQKMLRLKKIYRKYNIKTNLRLSFKSLIKSERSYFLKQAGPAPAIHGPKRHNLKSLALISAEIAAIQTEGRTNEQKDRSISRMYILIKNIHTYLMGSATPRSVCQIYI